MYLSRTPIALTALACFSSTAFASTTLSHVAFTIPFISSDLDSAVVSRQTNQFSFNVTDTHARVATVCSATFNTKPDSAPTAATPATCKDPNFSWYFLQHHAFDDFSLFVRHNRTSPFNTTSSSASSTAALTASSGRKKYEEARYKFQKTRPWQLVSGLSERINSTTYPPPSTNLQTEASGAQYWTFFDTALPLVLPYNHGNWSRTTSRSH